MLALSEGYGKTSAGDTLAQVLDAADGKVLIDWLRCQPLMLAGEGYAMVHAGLLPEWTIHRALGLAEEVEHELAGRNYRTFWPACLATNPPAGATSSGHRPAAAGGECDDAHASVDAGRRAGFVVQGRAGDAPPQLQAWFDAPNRRYADTPLIVGHWSALGLRLSPDLLAIDTGCLWAAA